MITDPDFTRRITAMQERYHALQVAKVERLYKKMTQGNTHDD